MQTTKPMNQTGKTVFSDRGIHGAFATGYALRFSVFNDEHTFCHAEEDREI